jgi:hypothetical protein
LLRDLEASSAGRKEYAALQLIRAKDVSNKKVSKKSDTALAAGPKLTDHLKMISS